MKNNNSNTSIISIIIPVYNVEKYLRECLNSIINQTYKNIEIIIVNDCSPDNSEDIILEYQARDVRIKYIKHEKNLGLGGARNTGIKNATGEWLTFLDSDDYLELDCLENMINLLEAKPNANLGIFSAMNFDDTKSYYDSYFDIPKNNQFPFISCTAYAKIFKTVDIINNNIYFPEHIKHEDEEFWWKYNSIIDPIYIADSQTYYQYRQRDNSLMKLENTKLDIPIIIKNIWQYMDKNSLLEQKKEYFLKVLRYLTNDYIYIQKSSEFQQKYFIALWKVLKQIHLTEADISTLDYVIQYLYSVKSEEDIYLIVELSKQREIYNTIINDKWYRFKELSQKQTIKQIIVNLCKR